MIPKIIHYCWLSNDPMPEVIRNWQIILPDYEFMHWDFNRFEKQSSLWVSQAFDSKKYAFAADYIRLFALYNHGGIYLDTDVDVIRSFNPLLDLKTMICYEAFGDRLEMATVGAEKGSPWVKQTLDYYQHRAFIKDDGTFDVKVLPKVVMEVFEANQTEISVVDSIEDALRSERKGMVPVFKSEFFSPKEYSTGKIRLTKNTFSIHYFTGSWLPQYIKLEHRFWQALGLNDPNFLTSLMKLKRRVMAVFKTK